MIGVQVGEEDPLYILPPHLELRQALQRAAPCVKHKFLSPGFHQSAWSKAMHIRRGTPSAQEGHRDVLPVRGRRNKDDHEEDNAKNTADEGRDHVAPP